MTTTTLSRRKFLKQGGIIVASFTLAGPAAIAQQADRKSTRLNSSH